MFMALCNRADLRNVGELELAEVIVVLGHGTLALEDLNENDGLVISSGREDLALLGGNSGTTLDEVGHDTASGLDTEGEGADVDEEDIAGAFLAGEDTALKSSAPSDCLIGVDTLRGFLAVEEVLEEGLDLGDTGRAANEDDLERLWISTRFDEGK